MNNNKYRCIANGSCNAVTSNPAILTVSTSITITNQPLSQTICAGSNASFSVNTSGSVSTYQWQVFTTGWTNVSNGGVYSGANSSTLTITNAGVALNGKKYNCVITGSCGSVLTNGIATLTVNGTPPLAPVLVSCNRDSLCENDFGTITLTAIGGSGSSLKWYYGICAGTFIGTGTTITVSAPQYTTTYYASWVNSCGNSPCVPVTVNVLPPTSPAGDIYGPSSMCAGSQGNVFMVYAIPSATTYEWSLPAGSTIISGDGTNSITVTAGPNAVSGNLKVRGKSACSNGDWSPLFAMTINQGPVVDAGTIDSTYAGFSMNLNGSYSGGISPYTVLWTPAASLSNPGILNPVASPAVTTTYTLYVTDGLGCVGHDTVTKFILLPAPRVVSGHISYASTIPIKLKNVQIALSVGNTVAYSANTDTLGNYLIPGVMPGHYKLSVSSTHTWGGVNAADALVILKHYVGQITLAGLKLKAADVDNSHYVNSNDALQASKRFTGNISSFAAGDWVFDTANLSVTFNNITKDLQGLCVGDVNASFIAPNNRIKPDVELKTSGQLEVDKEATFDIPVMTSQDLQPGAISLVMNYPSDILEIKDVVVNEAIGSLDFRAANGELRIAWYNKTALNLKAGEPLLHLVVRMLDPNAELQNVTFSLEGRESQITTDAAEVIHDVMLIVPSLKARSVVSTDFSLVTNFPNPLQYTTTFSIIPPEEGTISVFLFNATGEKVQEIVTNHEVSKSLNTFVFDASALAEGVYYYTVDFNGISMNLQRTKKMVIVR